MAGFGAAGLEIKRLSEIISELESAYLSIYGSGLNVSPESPDGQRIGITAEEYSILWEALEGLYASINPNTAVGAALDRAAQINYLTRKLGRKTEVDVYVTGVPNGAVAVGTRFGMSSNESAIFETAEQHVLGSDGTATFTVFSQEYEAITVNTGEVDQVLDAGTKVTSVVNPAPGVQGEYGESDADFRDRRNDAVALLSQAPVDGIEARLVNVEGVTHARVYENPDSSTDSNGILSHHIMCVVEGGADADIGEAIRLSKPLGTGTQGNTSAGGYNFERPTGIEVFFEVDVIKGSDYPVNGDNLLKAEIVRLGNSIYSVGDNVYALAFAGADDAVPGAEIVSISVGETAAAGVDRVNIAFNEVGEFEQSRIVINAVS